LLVRNPNDNAACESFMKTLKYEEVHRQEYRDRAEARASIEHFLERVYNQKRLVMSENPICLRFPWWQTRPEPGRNTTLRRQKIAP
jgi:hypothetical protein